LREKISAKARSRPRPREEYTIRPKPGVEKPKSRHTQLKAKYTDSGVKNHGRPMINITDKS